MNKNQNTFEAVCRVWKNKSKTPILIFPKEITFHKYMVNMWEEIGQHGEGDPQAITQMTRLATEEETAHTKKRYENLYDCELIMKKRIKINWKP